MARTLRKSKIEIADYRMTGEVQEILMECECGQAFWHRNDRNYVFCSKCHSDARLSELKKANRK